MGKNGRKKHGDFFGAVSTRVETSGIKNPSKLLQLMEVRIGVFRFDSIGRRTLFGEKKAFVGYATIFASFKNL